LFGRRGRWRIHSLSTIAAHQQGIKDFFAAWLVISVLAIVAIWVRHHKIIERMLLDPKLHDFNNQFDQIHPLSV